MKNQLASLRAALLELTQVLEFGRVHTSGYDYIAELPMTARNDRFLPLESPQHALDADDVLVVGCGERDNDLGHLSRAYPAHFRDTGPAVDEHHLCQPEEPGAKPVEELLATIRRVQPVPIESMDGLPVRREAVLVSPSGRQKGQRAAAGCWAGMNLNDITWKPVAGARQESRRSRLCQSPLPDSR